MLRAGFPILRSRCPDDTSRIGVALARHMYPGLTVLLYGDLGAGKTLFVRSVAKSLGASGVTSPSFAIEALYAADIPIVHVDLYRLSSREVPVMELEEHADDGRLLLIEWGERWISTPTDDRWDIRIDICDEDERSISLSAFGERAVAALSGGFFECL